MQLHPAQITDFRGGLNTGAPLVGFPPNQFPFAINADALVNGRLARRLGTRRTHLTRLTGTTGAVGTQSIGATAWWPDDIQRIAIIRDTVYFSDDDGVTWNVATNTVPLSSNWQFVTVRISGTNWLYAAAGGAGIFRWNGQNPGTWEAAPGVPAGGPQHMAVFGDRLYVAGHDGPLVQASAIGDPTDFTVPNGLALPVYSGKGPVEISGLYQVGPVLLVYRGDSTSYINGFGQSDLIVATGATGVSRSVGILNFQTVQDIGSNRAIWLSGRGFELYNGATIERISSPQLDKLLNEEALQLIQSEGPSSSARNTSMFLTDLSQYWCTLQIRVNRYILAIYDLRTRAWTVHEFSHRDELGLIAAFLGAPVGALVSAASGRLVDQTLTRPEAFSIDGFYRQLNFGDRDDTDPDNSLGEPIEMEAVLRPFVWVDVHHRKRARQIRVSAETLQPEALVEVAAIVDGLPAGGPNTLANPGFEEGLNGWVTDNVGAIGWSIDTFPRSGSNSLQFNPTGQTPGVIATARAASTSSNVVEGESWEFLAWAIPEVTGQVVRVGVRFLDSGGAFIAGSARYTPFEVIGREAKFVRLTIWGRAPAGATTAQGSIEVLPQSGGALVWFDDALLRRLRRHTLRVPTGNGDIPRQPLKARVNGRGRVQQVGVYTTDRVELVGVEERAEMLREP